MSAYTNSPHPLHILSNPDYLKRGDSNQARSMSNGNSSPRTEYFPSSPFLSSSPEVTEPRILTSNPTPTNNHASSHRLSTPTSTSPTFFHSAGASSILSRSSSYSHSNSIGWEPHPPINHCATVEEFDLRQLIESVTQNDVRRLLNDALDKLLQATAVEHQKWENKCAELVAQRTEAMRLLEGSRMQLEETRRHTELHLRRSCDLGDHRTPTELIKPDDPYSWTRSYSNSNDNRRQSTLSSTNITTGFEAPTAIANHTSHISQHRGSCYSDELNDSAVIEEAKKGNEVYTKDIIKKKSDDVVLDHDKITWKSRRAEPLSFGGPEVFWQTLVNGNVEKDTLNRLFTYLTQGENPNIAHQAYTEGPILYGYGLIHACIIINSQPLLTACLFAGANPNALSLCLSEDDKNTPLYLAAKCNFLKGVEILLANNADILHSYGAGQRQKTALMAAAENENIEIMRILIEASEGALVNLPDTKGITPLHIACSVGNVEAVTMLIENGGNMTVEDNDGDSCLHYAARAGKVDVLHSLIETHRCNPNICFTRKRGTPMDAARTSGMNKVEEYLKTVGGMGLKEMNNILKGGKEIAGHAKPTFGILKTHQHLD